MTPPPVEPAPPARPVDADLAERLQVYEQLLLKWQPKMNLVAPSTLKSIRVRHIEDSLQVSDALPLARSWIDDPRVTVAAAGWATWSCLVSLLPDAGLPLDELRALLDRVAAGVHQAPNRVRYCQNSFVISVGVYVEPLRAAALAVADQIGPVHVDVGETDCDVPLARPTIERSLARGAPKKKKTVRC